LNNLYFTQCSNGHDPEQLNIHIKQMNSESSRA